MTRVRPLSLGLLIALSACSADDVVHVPEKEGTELFWAVKTDIQAATVALGETQQLVATPLYPDGTPFPGLPRPTFRSADSARVHVDQNGLVTGKTVTSGINVTASLTVNGVTRSATTLVAVTAQRHALKSLQLVQANGDTMPSLAAINATVLMTPRMVDSADLRVNGLGIAVYPVDSRLALASTTVFRGSAIGKAKVVAMTTSYGRMFTDTIEVGIIYATSTLIYFGLGIVSPAATVIGVGGTITWNNNSYLQTPANITFDEPEKVPQGNIAIINYLQTASRTFPTAGTYNYTNTLSGARGMIVVREQPQY